jgi:hypothetical protein
MLKPNQPTQSIAAPVMVRLVVGRHRRILVALALAENQARRQSRNAGIDVQRSAAGKIQNAPVIIKAPEPPQTMWATGA